MANDTFNTSPSFYPSSSCAGHGNCDKTLGFCKCEIGWTCQCNEEK